MAENRSDRTPTELAMKLAEAQRHSMGWENSPFVTEEWARVFDRAGLADLVARCERAEAEVAKYRSTLDWHTTCEGCASVLDKSYEAYCSEEAGRARIERDALARRLEAVREYAKAKIAEVGGPAVRPWVSIDAYEILRLLDGEESE